MRTSQKLVIIGGGFAGLTAACYLAKAGYDVTLLEKNESIGGRASVLEVDGFKFDMGPTIYWMPDVFEKCYQDFGHTTSDFYKLTQLDPGYRVIFDEGDHVCISGQVDEIYDTFERIEPGSAARLKRFISTAKDNYALAINDLVYNPGERLSEIITLETVKRLPQVIQNIQQRIFSLVKDDRLRMILRFPALLLGAMTRETPALYSFMNYADFQLGTWHPEGGMYSVVRALEQIATSQGVTILTDHEVTNIQHDKGKVVAVETQHGRFECDLLLSGADYAHTERLVTADHRQYAEAYWQSRRFAPSALLYYVGFDTKIQGMNHHSLFFDADYNRHESDIYVDKKWPKDPLFYASFASMTDDGYAPEGQESATFLIPIAPGLDDDEATRERYFHEVIRRMSLHTGQDLKNHIAYQSSFSVSDFISRYHSYQGNAYGLANTLRQTHIFRPRMRSKKLNNLYFTGQLTLPGPGVPPSLISGCIISDLIQKYHPAA